MLWDQGTAAGRRQLCHGSCSGVKIKVILLGSATGPHILTARGEFCGFEGCSYRD